MARLRGPDGCPWDRQQTHATLAPYLLEEAHEVLEAIARGDQAALREELGDVLLQVVFHGQMASEAGGFSASDIVDGLIRKLIDRHPHVFGEVALGTPEEVLAQWHELKRREAPDRGPFDGVPESLPALARAQKLIGRAVANGMTDQWPKEPFQAAAAVAERLHRAVAALDRGSGGPEALGELLLAVAALAQAAGVDAESSLRGACLRLLDRIRRG
ncbi:MAG: MazG family protein [Firmicutes bacterium]|nr:MazG family protein [Bacillota bacterium]